MSAVTLNKQQIQKSLIAKKKKQATAKSVLCSPYVAKWPPVAGDVQENILKQLKQCFEAECVVDSAAKDSNPAPGILSRQHQLRKRLVCGINQVTRCLENDQLVLVIVDRSSPWQVHQHLAQLSAVRRCPAVAVDNVSTELSPLLAVSRLSAVGFKKLSDETTDSVAELNKMATSVARLCPTIELPWLEFESYLQTVKAERLDAKTATEISHSLPVSDCVKEEHRTTNLKNERSDKPKDYSHLYVHRNQQETCDEKQADYITLPSSSSDDDDYSDEDNNEHLLKTAPKTSLSPKTVVMTSKTETKRKMKYHSANIGLQQANVAKKCRNK